MFTAFEIPEPIENFQIYTESTPEEYSEKLNVPLDTVKNWFSEKSYPPVWVQNLVINGMRSH